MKHAIMLKYYQLRNFIRLWSVLVPYRFKHWAFKWNQDNEGDIVFRLVGVFHFVKFKEHTVFKFGLHQMESFRKYVNE